jgi:hypothetical protein
VECEVPMRSASNKGEWGRVKEVSWYIERKHRDAHKTNRL